MDQFRVTYSAIEMSGDEKSSTSSVRQSRGVNFPHSTLDEERSMVDSSGGGIGGAVNVSARRRSRGATKFFQRPRSLSIWSDISRTSVRPEER